MRYLYIRSLAGFMKIALPARGAIRDPRVPPGRASGPCDGAPKRHVTIPKGWEYGGACDACVITLQRRACAITFDGACILYDIVRRREWRSACIFPRRARSVRYTLIAVGPVGKRCRGTYQSLSEILFEKIDRRTKHVALLARCYPVCDK